MKKVLGVVVLLAAILGGNSQAHAGFGPRLFTDQTRYAESEKIAIVLSNEGVASITFDSTWVIERVGMGPVATLEWDESKTTLPGGQTRTWIWDQSADVSMPEFPGVGPGSYRAIVGTSRGPFHADFEIGQYFTLGFSHSTELSFVVWANQSDLV